MIKVKRPARSPGAALRENGGTTALPPRPAAPALPTLLATTLLTAACGDGTTEPQVTAVFITPEEALIVGEGGGQQFSAFAHDLAGNTITPGAEWSVAQPGIAEISEHGFATGRASGVTTVTATVGGVSGTAKLEVYVPPVITEYIPGERYHGRRFYVEYIPGELPVILASAHGGQILPDEIPDRSYGVLRNDLNSLALTMAMRQALIDLTGQAPHVILSHLHRSKLDANREIEEAAQDNPYAEQAWREFHEWIVTARATVWTDFGRGLFLDIHGHGHEIERLELGYLLTSAELNRPDANLNSLDMVARTSIRELGRTSPLPFSQLLRGPTSLGGLFEEEDIPSVPSPVAPGPGDAPYFRGGYNTRRHGSLSDSEVIDGVQIEHHYRGVRDTDENRAAYAAKAAMVIRTFMLEHYGFFERTSR